LTPFKVVLAGDKRDYWYTRGFFVRSTCSNLRGGFLKALVGLLGIASMSVRCSAGPTMPLRDSEKPRGLVCSGERWVGSPTRSKRAPVESPESLRGISTPGAAGAIADSSGDGLLCGVEMTPT
jgi:hypothetical protein